MDDRRAVEAAGLAGSLAGVGAVAAMGALPVLRNRAWYAGLDRPRHAVPDAVFGPAWALLYANQAVAAWLVWRGDARRAEFDVPALSTYGVQLWLNLAWTFLFFGLRRPGLALLDICALWVAVAVTMHDFARKHRFAATLLVPYLAWVTYAVALNAAIWWRNR
jgi:tryptophan-rich sensory protein